MNLHATDMAIADSFTQFFHIEIFCVSSGIDAKKLISVCDKAKYSSTQKTIVGNWDISVVLRKAEGGICSVYFAEDKFYVAVDDTQYYFSPVSDRADAYKEFYGELERLIIEKKAAMA